MGRRVSRVAIVIITHKGKILLLRRSKSDPSYPQQWWFAGGHVEKGESIVQGGIREVKEETDINVAPYFLEYMGSYKKSPTKEIYLFRYEAPSEYCALLDGEHDKYIWTSFSDSLNYNRQPIFKKIIDLTQGANMAHHSSLYGLTSFSSPGSSYHEAAIDKKITGVTKKGMQQVSHWTQARTHHGGDPAHCQCPDTANCDCHGHQGSYGDLYVAARKDASIYGDLYVGARKDASIYGNIMTAAGTLGRGVTQGVGELPMWAKVLGLAAVGYGGYKLWEGSQKSKFRF